MKMLRSPLIKNHPQRFIHCGLPTDCGFIDRGVEKQAIWSTNMHQTTIDPPLVAFFLYFLFQPLLAKKKQRREDNSSLRVLHERRILLGSYDAGFADSALSGLHDVKWTAVRPPESSARIYIFHNGLRSFI